MKKFLNIGLLVTMLVSCLSVSAKGVKPHSVQSIVATITGNVTLLAKRKTFPSDLSDLYAGNASAVNFSKQGKKIPVSGRYTGGSKVTVTGKGKGRGYSFEIPVIQSILETASKNSDKSSSGLVAASFSSISKDISVEEVGTSRDGKSARVAGSFSQAGALGRFSLNLKFQ